MRNSYLNYLNDFALFTDNEGIVRQ